MSEKHFLFLCFSAAALSSCDPALIVTLVNQTPTDKNIRVIYPRDAELIFDGIRDDRDSISLYDPRTSVNDGTTPRIWLDTLARIYTFNLPAGRGAVVEGHMGAYPAYRQLFIINQTDTVELKRKEGPFKKKSQIWLGGEWSYKIKEAKK